MARPIAIALLSLTLAACGQQSEPAPETKSIALGDTGPREARADQSPDTTEARWSVADNGQAIRFGNEGEPPWLTLGCMLEPAPIEFVVIRHADALPGQTALFPFVGNGMRSRFLANAKLTDGEWRWEASLPVSDPQLDVFEGTRDLTATLPGRGMLEINGSRIPGEFLEWCRAGGRTAEVEDYSESELAAQE